MNQFLRKYAMLTTNEGRMESMNQLLKKCVLLAGCAALALCFTTRSAHAQTVAGSGTGEHLLFAYWSTEQLREHPDCGSLSPWGVRNSGEGDECCPRRHPGHDGRWRRRISIPASRRAIPGRQSSPQQGNLMVGDAGGCDGFVAQPGESTDRDGGLPDVAKMATPASGEMVALGADQWLL